MNLQNNLEDSLSVTSIKTLLMSETDKNRTINGAVALRAQRIAWLLQFSGQEISNFTKFPASKKRAPSQISAFKPRWRIVFLISKKTLNT